MEIREAGAADYDNYCRLVTEIDVLHARNAPRHFRMPEPAGRSLEYFRALLSHPEGAVFFAEEAGTAQGFVRVRLERVPDIPVLVPKTQGYIADLAVGLNFQRRGVGRALLARAKKWAAERGASELSLSVAAFNEGARKMYEKEGFSLQRSVMVLPIEPA